MNLTARGAVLALAVPVLLLGGIAVKQAVDSKPSCPSGSALTVYEDGTGVCYTEDKMEVGTFPGGTFKWDCRTMGNKVCGQDIENWGEYDGHPGCLAWIGDTTLVRCSDGYVTST